MLQMNRRFCTHIDQWRHGQSKGGMFRHGQSLHMPEGFEYDVHDEQSVAGGYPASGSRKTHGCAIMLPESSS